MSHQQESFLPFSSQQSLSCCLSCVAKRSSPKPRGPLYSPSELCGPFPHFRTSWPSTFPLRTSWCSLFFFTSEPHGPLPFPSEPRGSLYLLQNRVAPYLLQSSMVYPLFTSEPHGLLFSMAAGPRFKSQCPSSFAASFPTPPTVSYTCQHPGILPALLGCHSKSGQVWPHGMEPIISKLSRRPCNQGELLPRPKMDVAQSRATAIYHIYETS